MIPSAVNIPLSELANSLHLDRTTFLQKYGFEKPLSNQRMIFYCRSGMRSTTASDVAKRNGYTKYGLLRILRKYLHSRTSCSILNYKGSWLEWVEKESKGSSA